MYETFDERLHKVLFKKFAGTPETYRHRGIDKNLIVVFLASKPSCSMDRNNCLNARRRSILLMKVVRKHGRKDSLTLTNFVVKSVILSLMLGPPRLYEALSTYR